MILYNGIWGTGISYRRTRTITANYKIISEVQVMSLHAVNKNADMNCAH